MGTSGGGGLYVPDGSGGSDVVGAGCIGRDGDMVCSIYGH